MCEGSRFEFGLLSLEAGTSNTSRLLWCDGLVAPFVSFCRTLVARSGQPQVVQPRSFLGCHHSSSLPRSHWKFCQAVPRIPNINIHKYTQISFLKDPQRLWLLAEEAEGNGPNQLFKPLCNMLAPKSTGPKWSCLRQVKNFCAKGLRCRRIRLTPAVWSLVTWIPTGERLW